MQTTIRNFQAVYPVNVCRDLAIASIICVFSPALHALETDQFTVPPEPLSDIGPKVSELIWSKIVEIVESTNAQLDTLSHQKNNSSNNTGLLRQIHQLTTEDSIVDALYSAIGHGFPEVKIELLVQDLAEEHDEQPAMYETSFGDSILSNSGFFRPLNTIGIVPSVHIHSVYMGTDKLGHMFQQGHEYYNTFRSAERRSKSNAEAIKAAISHGRSQENGIYGYIPSGAYSNADMASNYAGLKFYLHLTRTIQIDGKEIPPLLMLEDGRWNINDDASLTGTETLKMFISDHFDEARNPSHFDWLLRGGIRGEVFDRGESWVKFHNTTREQEVDSLKQIDTWFGEEYGHSGWEDVITIVNGYFDKKK